MGVTQRIYTNRILEERLNVVFMEIIGVYIKAHAGMGWAPFFFLAIG
jgi:hypothetical protein